MPIQLAAITQTLTSHDRKMVLLVFRSTQLHELLKRYPGKSFYNVLHPSLKGCWKFFLVVLISEILGFFTPLCQQVPLPITSTFAHTSTSPSGPNLKLSLSPLAFGIGDLPWPTITGLGVFLWLATLRTVTPLWRLRHQFWSGRCAQHRLEVGCRLRRLGRCKTVGLLR